MDLSGKRLLVVCGAGLIGSHIVDQLLEHDVEEVLTYDTSSRCSYDNLERALRDPRATVYPHGGDVIHADTLGRAMQGIDGVFHLAAVWLLQCHEFPET